MKYLVSFLTIFLACMCSCGQWKIHKKPMDSQEFKFTNHLVHETSPYLLQHAHNPVNWYPWGKEALDKAKNENKLIIISIGYAACHWCHVMENESFEDVEVAEFMNQHFISIKVDREERPDIDQVYMNAIQLITGSGGWPLNCIALPDGRPFYGGTYFRKAQWLEMLSKINDYVKKNPEKAEEQARSLSYGIQSAEEIFKNPGNINYSGSSLDSIFSAWENHLDFKNGGHLGAPKFPLPVGFQFLLAYHHLTDNAEALKAVSITLDKMSDGGIYDQAGGGFSRYSTDEHWKVPHFEKMLYDNAQLVSLYSSAFQLMKSLQYKKVVTETLDFIGRELTSSEGGFYSSLDADSEGEEGKYYVWSHEEIQNTLGENAGLIAEYYNVTERGNWENSRNILFKSVSSAKIAEKYKISENDLLKRVAEANKLLLKERSNRVHPGLDDKILTSWNALMLKAYVDAYRVFDNNAYLEIALKSAEFINKKVKSEDNRLFRNYKNGNASINGFLDDYAFTISAFISLYQASFDEKWIHEAKDLMDYALAHFYNEENGMFFYTSDIDPALIARKMEISDNVIPSSNSEMAKNLFILGHYFYQDDYISKSDQMLKNVLETARQAGAYYANWDILLSWFINEPFEVSIVGKDFEVLRKELDKYYLPDVFLSGGKDEGTMSILDNKLIHGQTTIYVCRNKQCKLPVTEVKDALKQILQ